MEIKAQYFGLYKDDLGTVDICIFNDFKKIYVEIDGVQFSGKEFSDLSILEENKYTHKQLERFTFLSNPFNKTELVPKTLCNCIFDIIIPQTIIVKQNHTLLEVDLNMRYGLGNVRQQPVTGGLTFEDIRLMLTIDNKTFSGQGDIIETALNHINQQFDGLYQFRNCYGCMYGDYSVFGQSSFGTMLCFVDHKEQYLNISDKNDYMKIENDKEVQEIYSCNQYEMRKTRMGYRG